MRSFLRGDIPGGREVVAEVRRVVEQAKAGDILQPGGAVGQPCVVVAQDDMRPLRRVPREGTFYRTRTVEKIAEVLDYCHEHRAIGCCTADFGVGKTEAIKDWRRRTAHSIQSLVFEFDSFTGHDKVEFTRALALVLGLEAGRGSHKGAAIFRAVCERLREAPVLIIFDQVEAVRPRVLQIIRELHDRTKDAGVGIVMLAAPILLSRLTRSCMADLGALTSRISIWAPLAGITRTEMASIVKAEGVGNVDEAAFDLWYTATGGSMRRLMRSLDLLKSKHSGRRVTERTVIGVAGHLFGMNLGEAA
ncbi:MAG TPA: AAA family ATPase [Bryobacteraceae bacterium]|nr:AAA family ATPase [Bryobacteraceae bacterium]